MVSSACSGRSLCDGLIKALLGVGEQLVDGRLDVGGLDFVKGNAEGDLKERIHLLLM